MCKFSRLDKLINSQRLEQTLFELVNSPSPTGEEGVLAHNIAQHFRDHNISASTQAFNSTQANVFATINGKKTEDRNNLLLYAPLDTVTSNNKAEDTPWLDKTLQPHMLAKAYRQDGHVFGLGAHNPKGHAACIIEAAHVLSELQLDFNGNLYFGFGAGGMPTHSREGFPANTGHGIGCAKLLEKLPPIDAAIIAKSGTTVTWQEVGFIWLEVTVEGQHLSLIHI